MAWHVFEKLLEGVANYSPFIGKIWITFLFIFRIIMVASVGDTVYGDEQSAFKCNTLQPGCENVCFNHFSPISQIRFWAVQILFVGTPSIVFIVFAMHKMSTLAAAKEKAERYEKQIKNETEQMPNGKSSDSRSKSVHISGLPEYGQVVELPMSKKGSSHGDSKERLYNKNNNRLGEVIKMKNGSVEDNSERKVKRKTVYHKDGTTEVVKTPSIARAYVAQAILRTLVEVVFLYLQYRMYLFKVDELYVCEGFPCPKQVDCFVSRPMEKTLFLRFMYAMTGLSLLLNIMELFQLAYTAAKGHRTPNQEFHFDPHGQRYRKRGGRGRRRRRVVHNQTFPDLGPFPRTMNNSFGDSSNDDTMDSDYRYYSED